MTSIRKRLLYLNFAAALVAAALYVLEMGEPRRSTNIGSVADLSRSRELVLSEVFPAGPPAQKGKLIPIASPIARLAHLEVKEIRISGSEVRPVLWVPQGANGDLVVLHQGHSWGFEDGNFGAVIEEFVSRRFAVAAIFMPGGGAHISGSAETHDQVRPALADLLAPLIITLNTLEDEFLSIYMLGLSGGAWTATLAAAIDTRIRGSYPIAGTLPLYIAIRGPGKRDYEQRLPGLSLSYQDLYLLGATPGRRQKQILYVNDPCCFSRSDYSRAWPFGEFITELANRLGGSYELVWAEKDTHEWHLDVIRDHIIPEITKQDWGDPWNF